jgi:hypothetical protein
VANPKNATLPKCTLMPERLVSERYRVCTKTIDRWSQDPELGFPPVIWIRNRRFRDVAALDAWDQRMLLKAAKAGAAEVAA